MRFTKIEGAGNDFIVVEGPALEGRAIAKLCDRRLGIGADGLIFVSKSSCADVKFIYYNCDGSRAGFCGNGLRAVARFVGRDCTIESDVGLHHAKVLGEEIAVNLPAPKEVKRNFFSIPEGPVHFAHVGVPHAVLFVKDFANFPEVAKKLRHDARFPPEGSNVHFAKVVARDKIEVRSFERGVEGETFACGSGGAAIFLTYRRTEQLRLSDKASKIGRNRFFELANQQVVSSVLQNRFRLNFEDLFEKSSYSILPYGLSDRVSICFRSGDEVSYFYEGAHLMMQGPARITFEGTFYADWNSKRDQNSRISCGSHSQ